jgi:hypothetical protein
MRHLKRSNTGFKKIDLLESLFELVLRPTKEFSKSFIQKAIYKRNSESLSNIVNLANLEEGDKEMALQFKFCASKY